VAVIPGYADEPECGPGAAGTGDDILTSVRDNPFGSADIPAGKRPAGMDSEKIGISGDWQDKDWPASNARDPGPFTSCNPDLRVKPGGTFPPAPPGNVSFLPSEGRCRQEPAAPGRDKQ